MQLHEARTASLSNKKRMRVGRGPASGKGKTCGRGREGAASRSGWSMRGNREGGQMPLFRRLPKRGFSNGPFRAVYAVVNVGALSAFPAKERVDREALRQAGLVKGPRRTPIKILGEGQLSVALTVCAERFSKSAREKIEQAGGTVEWTRGAPKKPAPNFVRLAREKKRLQAIEAAKAAAAKGGSKRKKTSGAKKTAATKPPPKPAKGAKGKSKGKGKGKK